MYRARPTHPQAISKPSSKPLKGDPLTHSCSQTKIYPYELTSTFIQRRIQDIFRYIKNKKYVQGARGKVYIKIFGRVRPALS